MNTTTITKKMSKTDKIKAHLKAMGNITSWEAIQLYRATRLSAIIFNLKKDGWNIATEMKKTDDGTPYAKYTYKVSGKLEQLSLNLGSYAY